MNVSRNTQKVFLKVYTKPFKGYTDIFKEYTDILNRYTDFLKDIKILKKINECF
jgi:hypothetical protein